MLFNLSYNDIYYLYKVSLFFEFSIQLSLKLVLIPNLSEIKVICLF